MFKESSKGVQVRFKGFSRSFKGVLRGLKEVQQVYQGSFNDASRKSPRSFKEVSRVFKEHFKGILR